MSQPQVTIFQGHKTEDFGDGSFVLSDAAASEAASADDPTSGGQLAGLQEDSGPADVIKDLRVTMPFPGTGMHIEVRYNVTKDQISANVKFMLKSIARQRAPPGQPLKLQLDKPVLNFAGSYELFKTGREIRAKYFVVKADTKEKFEKEEVAGKF